VELRLETVLNDNKALSLVVDEADLAVDQLERQLGDSRRLVAQLTQQLSDSFMARKQGAFAAAKYVLTC
jgi:hypothetical protein